MISTEDIITIILIIAFFVYLASRDKESKQRSKSRTIMEEITYAPQYTCPNCGELFNGHECENCHYTENR